jgi:Amt family ammonium transporter
MALLTAQIVGILAVGLFVVLASAAAWGVLRAVIGIRVPADEEQAGLDVGEHGISAYPEFHLAGGAAAPAAAGSAPRIGAPAVERTR